MNTDTPLVGRADAGLVVGGHLRQHLTVGDPRGKDLVDVMTDVLRAAIAGAAIQDRLSLEDAVDALPPVVASALSAIWPSPAVLPAGPTADLVERAWLSSLSTTERTNAALGRATKSHSRKLDLELWEDIENTIVDLYDRITTFFDVNNEVVTQRFANIPGAYLDGTHFELTNVMCQVFAVTSISAPVSGSFLAGLKTLINFKTHLPEIREARARVTASRDRAGRQLDAEETFAAIFPGLHPRERSSAPLFRALTDYSHPYRHCRQALFEIFAGRTLDTWDPEYVQRRPSLWGGQPLRLSPDSVTQHTEAAVRDRLSDSWTFIEYYGPRAAARVLAYHDCLRNPSTSSAVPVDTTLATFLGRPDWFAAGSYLQAAEDVRALTADLVEQRGVEMRPHHVASAIGVFVESQSWERKLVAGAAISSRLQDDSSPIDDIAAYLKAKDDERAKLCFAGAIGSALTWLTGVEPQLEIGVAPTGQSNAGELRIFFFGWENRGYLFLIGEDVLGGVEILDSFPITLSDEDRDDVVRRVLERFPGVLGAYGALTLRRTPTIWAAARELAEEHQFAPWDIDALDTYVNRMGGIVPVVSTYVEPVAESLEITSAEAIESIRRVLEEGATDQTDRDVAWTLLCLMRDGWAPPIAWYRSEGLHG